MLTYKGYVGSVTYDAEAGILHGDVVNIDAITTFIGISVNETRQALYDSVEFYLAFCAEQGDAPERPRPIGLTPEQQEELDALAAMPDEDIDLSEMPEVVDWAGAKRGVFYRPAKEQISSSSGLLTYKGYAATLEVDYGFGLLLGRVADIDDVVTFQAERVADLEREFHTSVDIYLQTCREVDKAPDTPQPHEIGG